jgi:cytochrome c553
LHVSAAKGRVSAVKFSTPISRAQLVAFIVAVFTAFLSLFTAHAQQRQMPPAWPYAQVQLPPGEVPPQVAAPPTPPVTNPPAANADAPAPPLLQAKGSTAKFTQQQVGNSYAPADWFPDSHPPMPETVAHGKPGVARACGLCHLPDGRGRPENAPLQGLPYDYIVQQLHDFQQGLRRSADPRKANTLEMENIAKTMSEDEIKEAAKYFSTIKGPKYVRVVETDKVPATRVQGRSSSRRTAPRNRSACASSKHRKMRPKRGCAIRSPASSRTSPPAASNVARRSPRPAATAERRPARSVTEPTSRASDRSRTSPADRRVTSRGRCTT